MPTGQFKVYVIVVNTQEINVEHFLETIAQVCGIPCTHLVENVVTVSTVNDAKGDTRNLLREAFFNSLPPQKQNVVCGVVCGFSNKQIAQSLDIVQGVVAEYLTEVYQRLEIFENRHGNFPKTVSRYYLIQFFGDYFKSHSTD